MRSSVLALAAVSGMASAQLTVVGANTTCVVPTYTLGGGPVATITQAFTSTYCPACPNVVTTYTTQYQAFCPTGLTNQVYTVQETCSPNSCRQGNLPPGFTTSVGTCNVCGNVPITATITQPYTNGPSATITQTYPTVYQTVTNGNVVDVTYTVTASCAAAPCPTVAPGSPAPGFTASVYVDNAGATPVTATVTVPANVNAAAPSGGAAGSAGSGTTPASYQGAASSNKAGFLFAGLAGVAAIAQLL